MKEKGCFVIYFDNSHVSVRWEGRKAFDVLDFLFKDRLNASDDSTLSLFTLKEINPQTLLLCRGEKLLSKGNPGKAAVILLERVIHELAKETKGGLLFHAASLSHNGRSILMPGQSGSGKTFLAARLANSGYSYLTDEMTLVESESYCLYGFSKPLHIKNSYIFKQQISLKKSCKNPKSSGYNSLTVEDGVLINCFNVNPAERRRKTKVAMIIFPKYEKGKKICVRRLTCANTGLLLMENLINSKNLTSHGFHEVSMLARKLPAYIIAYGKCSQVVTEVNSLLDC